jgi:S1-C subfamily serine protease
VKITKSGYKPWERRVRTSTGAAGLVAELEAIPSGYVPALATKPRSLDSGLGIKGKTTDMAGAEISEIASGSVADHAGLHVGDVINSIDGKAIGTPARLEAELSNRVPGTKIRVGYMVRTSLEALFRKKRLSYYRDS